MLRPGPARKVTIYLNDDTGSGTGFLHEDVLTLLQAHGIGGASALRPCAGFGSHGRLHVSGAGSVEGEHLPIIIVFIDTEEKVQAVLPALLELVSDGLIESHPTEILKAASQLSGVIV